jgi:hypothetical protein
MFKKLLFVGIAVAGTGLAKLFGRKQQAVAYPPVDFAPEPAVGPVVELDKKVDLAK